MHSFLSNRCLRVRSRRRCLRSSIISRRRPVNRQLTNSLLVQSTYINPLSLSLSLIRLGSSLWERERLHFQAHALLTLKWCPGWGPEGYR